MKRCCSLVFILFGILRLLGAFPYTWKYLPVGELKVKRSVWATMWSCVLVMSLITLSLSCVANSPDYHRNVTSTISTHILNYMTYLISAIFFPYLALRSAKLAHVLRRIDETSFPLRHRLVGQEDSVQILCVLGITGALSYATYSAYMVFITNPNTKTSVLYLMPTIVCDIVIETTALVLGLLLYFSLKILSLQSEDAVLALGSATPWAAARGGSSSRWATPRRSGDLAATEFMECKRRPDETALAIRGVSCYLLALDDIVLEMVDYAGPAAAMILLSSSTNATVMLYLTITNDTNLFYYYLAFTVMKFLGVVHIAFVPDALRCKREKSLRWLRRLLMTRIATFSIKVRLREVEQVLNACPRFLVCRLFTLDRHVILSVASSVVTYLVIALQFGSSETPSTLPGNCTVRHIE